MVRQQTSNPSGMCAAPAGRRDGFARADAA